jgi:hypothetical protein
MQTAAAGAAAADQFEFTIKTPVTVERRRSAMLPLLSEPVAVVKTLVYSGVNSTEGVSTHPAISAQLTNTTSVKLPAGPITVFDGGVYAGDALIDFLPLGEKRLISWGEDLSVTASSRSASAQSISTVTLDAGVMTITRKRLSTRHYSVRNASAEDKRIVIEHPIRWGAKLVEPVAPDEETASLYRFERDLRGGEALTLSVQEENPTEERIILSGVSEQTFAAYIANGEIPANVRERLEKAASLKRAAAVAKQDLTDKEAARAKLVTDQDRIRRNLEAVGNTTVQGQEYLARMAQMDKDIDEKAAACEDAAKALKSAEAAYSLYIASQKL